MGRRNGLVGIVVAALLLGFGHSAVAQTAPVEIGANINGLLSPMTSITSGGLPGVGVRVGVSVNDRFSVEGGVMFGRDTQTSLDGYGVQVKQRLGASPRAAVRPFLTYGLAGVYSRYRTAEYRTARGSGTAIIPAHTETMFLPPMLALFGGGVERTLAPRLVVRADAQVVAVLAIPVGVRATTGLSIVVGRSMPASRARGAKGPGSDPAAR